MAIRKRGKGFSVVHCHGKKKGKTIGKHKTRKKALAQHRAIQSNRRRRGT
tara:strand:+ start:360 stop:509 length:150 start_codon:yes stop_codon:yes gene_type:complete